MRIIIIGAGIGGLSTYHAMRKYLQSEDRHDVTVKLYESHHSAIQIYNDTPPETNVDGGGDTTDGSAPISTTGGGLGLAPNGLRALSTLSPYLVDHIHAQAFMDGAKTAFRNSRGKLLGVYWNGRRERYGGFGMVMVGRGVVHIGTSHSQGFICHLTTAPRDLPSSVLESTSRTSAAEYHPTNQEKRRRGQLCRPARIY